MINVLDYLSHIANGACDIWAELGKERQSRAERRARLREEHAKWEALLRKACAECRAHARIRQIVPTEAHNWLYEHLLEVSFLRDLKR